MSPLTMTVSAGSKYSTHQSVVWVEHLAVVLRARLKCCGHCVLQFGLIFEVSALGIVLGQRYEPIIT